MNDLESKTREKQRKNTYINKLMKKIDMNVTNYERRDMKLGHSEAKRSLPVHLTIKLAFVTTNHSSMLLHQTCV